MRTRGMRAVLLAVATLAAVAGAAEAATYSYTFDGLTASGFPGTNLIGQDGWKNVGGSNLTVRNDLGGMTGYSGNVLYGQSDGQASRKNDGGWSYALGSDQIVMEYVGRTNTSGSVWYALGADTNGDGTVGAAGDEIAFQFGMQGGRAKVRESDFGAITQSAPLVSGTEMWKVRLVADLSANGGEGVGRVYAQYMGEHNGSFDAGKSTAMRPITGLQNVDLKINSRLAAGGALDARDPSTWNGLYVRAGNMDMDALSIREIASKAPSTTVLADSVKDWQAHAAQPHGQWSYGRYSGAANWDSFAENTNPGTYYPGPPGSSWIGGNGDVWNVPGYPQIGEYSAAPSNGEWAVRRWTSDVEGQITVHYDALRSQSGSTGQIVGIYQNGAQVWSQNLDNSNVHFMGSVPLTVLPGDKIDFTVDSKGYNNSDWTHFSARIEDGPPHANPGLVAHWSLNERSDMPVGNPNAEPYNRRATVGDSSGNNHHMFTHNTWSNERVAGLVDNALEFHNGTGYGITFADDIGDGATELTLSAWIHPDGKDNWDGVLTNWGGGFTGIALADYNSQGYLAPTFRVMNAGNVTSTIDTPIGEWSHVVAVWKSGELHRIYINGELGANNDVQAFTGAIDMDEWYLGTDRLIANRWFDGLIDDAGIWTRALSEYEIRQLYQGGLAGIDLAHASIVDVPEPATLCLLAAAVGGLGAYVRGRRR